MRTETLERSQCVEAKEIKRYCKGRAAKASKLLLDAYDKHDIESSIGDCLADLLHLCAQKKIDFWDRLDSAQMHFSAEALGGEHG